MLHYVRLYLYISKTITILWRKSLLLFSCFLSIKYLLTSRCRAHSSSSVRNGNHGTASTKRKPSASPWRQQRGWVISVQSDTCCNKASSHHERRAGGGRPTDLGLNLKAINHHFLEVCCTHFWLPESDSEIMQKSHWIHPSQVLSANCFTGQPQTLAPSHCCLMSKFTFIVVEYISLSSRITRPFWFQEIAPGHQCFFCPHHLRIMLPPFPSWKCNSILFPLWCFLQE